MLKVSKQKLPNFPRSRHLKIRVSCVKWSQPEERRVSRFGFVPAEVGGHLKEELGQAVLFTSLLPGGIQEGLQPGVSLTGHEPQLAPRRPPGLGGDVQFLVAGHQKGSQGAGGASRPGVVRHTASWRGARCGAGGVVRGRRAGLGVGTGVASLPAGGGRSGWRPERGEAGISRVLTGVNAELIQNSNSPKD